MQKNKPEIERRNIHRIYLNESDELRGCLGVKETRIFCKILDFNFESVKVDLKNNSIDPTEFLYFEIYYGEKMISKLENIKIAYQKNGTAILQLTPTRAHGSSREKTRFNIRPSMRPTIIAKDPIRLTSTLHFTVTNLNSEGLLLETSLTNKHLLKNLIFENAAILLPAVGIITVSFQLRFIKANDGYLNIGAKFLEISKENLEMLAQFLLFGSTTDGPMIQKFKDIKKDVYSLRKLGSALRIESISLPTDYAQVLETRLLAYKTAGIITETMTFDSMADKYDERSIILGARLNGKIIGTVRLIFSQGDEEDFMFEASIPFKNLKGKLTRKNCVEVSRLAVDPQFQDTDIVVKLFKEVARQTILNKKVALCMARTAQRLSYFRLGFIKISPEVKHPLLEKETLAVLKIEPDGFLKGRGMTATAWHLVVKDVAESMVYANVISKIHNQSVKLILKQIESFLLAGRARMLSFTKGLSKQGKS